MRVLLQLLQAFVAVGLLAAPCVPRPLPPSTHQAEARANEQHEWVALHRETGAEALTCKSSDDSSPRRGSGGGAPPCAPAARGILGLPNPPTWYRRAGDETGGNGRIAQTHLSVNGVANAHGARA